MKSIRSAARSAPHRPFFFCCHLARDGRERFNFRAAVGGPPMRSGFTWGPAVAVLAGSLILRSHPEWPRTYGPREASRLARHLAHEFACEYLLPNAGRPWIISSSTVREFVADTLEEEHGRATRTKPLVAGERAPRLPRPAPREVAHGSL
jgi:hypothetical protein